MNVTFPLGIVYSESFWYSVPSPALHTIKFFPYTVNEFSGSLMTVPSVTFSCVGTVPVNVSLPASNVTLNLGRILRSTSNSSVSEAPSVLFKVRMILPWILPSVPGSSPSVALSSVKPCSDDHAALILSFVHTFVTVLRTTPSVVSLVTASSFSAFSAASFTSWRLCSVKVYVSLSVSRLSS